MYPAAGQEGEQKQMNKDELHNEKIEDVMHRYMTSRPPERDWLDVEYENEYVQALSAGTQNTGRLESGTRRGSAC